MYTTTNVLLTVYSRCVVRRKFGTTKLPGEERTTPQVTENSEYPKGKATVGTYDYFHFRL